MARLSGKAKVRSAISYLEKLETKENVFLQKRMLRIAQITIYNAYFKRDHNPYQNAERKVLKEWEGQYEFLEKHAPHLVPQLNPSTVPLAAPAETISFVDGRDGRQWTASIQAYLSWRAGDCWRPQRDRWHPARTYYLDAIRLLNQLSSGDPWRLQQYKPASPAQPELPPKKPATSAAEQIPLPLPGLAIQQQLPIWRI